MTKIITTGLGVINSAADIVEISISVSGIDYDYDKALSQAAIHLNEVKASLKKAGFDEKSLKTLHFNVRKQTQSVKEPDGSYKEKFIGYECIYENVLRFDFDMQRLSESIAILSKCKAFPSFNISFCVKQTEEIKDSLLKAAFDDAKKSALSLCKQAALKLLNIESITYSSDTLNVYSQTGMDTLKGRIMFEAQNIDITPEEIKNTLSVEVVWQAE